MRVIFITLLKVNLFLGCLIFHKLLSLDRCPVYGSLLGVYHWLPIEGLFDSNIFYQFHNTGTTVNTNTGRMKRCYGSLCVKTSSYLGGSTSTNMILYLMVFSNSPSREADPSGAGRENVWQYCRLRCPRWGWWWQVFIIVWHDARLLLLLWWIVAGGQMICSHMIQDGNQMSSFLYWRLWDHSTVGKYSNSCPGRGPWGRQVGGPNEVECKGAAAMIVRTVWIKYCCFVG
jgi:hypothetical protein